MKNILILRYFAFERGIRTQGDKQGQPYFVAKFLDDDNNKMVSFIIEDTNLQNEVLKLEKYKQYQVEVEFNRNRYGNYELSFVNISID